MSDGQVFDVPNAFAANALLDERKYREMREAANSDRLTFWRTHGKRLDWIAPYTHVCDVSYKTDDLHIKWYQDGTLNASMNCLDRHLQIRKTQNTLPTQRCMKKRAA